MTLTEATEKVKKIADRDGGRFGAKANFVFNEGGMIHLDDSVSPTVVSNDEKLADCSMRVSLENFEKLMNGDLNPMMAFMSGKLKIEGDKGVAMKLAGLF